MPFTSEELHKFLRIKRTSIPRLCLLAGVERRLNPEEKSLNSKYLPFSDEETERLLRAFHEAKQGKQRARYKPKKSK